MLFCFLNDQGYFMYSLKKKVYDQLSISLQL